MFRSRRLLVAAIVGLAIFNPVSQNGSAQEATENRPESPKAEQKPVDLRPIQDALDGLTGAVKSLKDNPEAEAENQRAKSDLKAQEDMAKWAERLFWATAASLLLTGAGIFLIWRTLVHTRRAADASKDMADEARKATTAAIDQLSLTRSEIAARIVPRRVTFRHIGRTHQYIFSYGFKNVGRTPATQVEAEAFISFKDPVTSDEVEHCFNAIPDLPALVEGVESSIELFNPTVVLNEAQFNAARFGGLPIFARFEFGYFNGFAMVPETRHFEGRLVANRKDGLFADLVPVIKNEK